MLNDFHAHSLVYRTRAVETSTSYSCSIFAYLDSTGLLPCWISLVLVYFWHGFSRVHTWSRNARKHSLNISITFIFIFILFPCKSVIPWKIIASQWTEYCPDTNFTMLLCIWNSTELFERKKINKLNGKWCFPFWC